MKLFFYLFIGKMGLIPLILTYLPLILVSLIVTRLFATSLLLTVVIVVFNICVCEMFVWENCIGPLFLAIMKRFGHVDDELDTEIKTSGFKIK